MGRELAMSWEPSQTQKDKYIFLYVCNLGLLGKRLQRPAMGGKCGQGTLHAGIKCIILPNTDYKNSRTGEWAHE